MSDLERRAREAAQREREESERHEAEQRRLSELYRERRRSEAAAKAADEVERVLGIRTGLSQWKSYGHPQVGWSEYETDQGEAVTTEIEDISVYWFKGILSARESTLTNEKLTLAQFGTLLEARRRQRSAANPGKPWYKKVFS